MAELAPLPRYRFADDNGAPLSGGLLYTYEAGTNTPKATFKDVAGVEPNTNPVVLDSEGRAQVRIASGSYKFVLKDASGATIWTEDNIQSFADIISTTGALAVANNLNDLADLPTALTNLGLDNVNNTSDADKPVSDETQTALDLKAPIASPTFTGTVSGLSATMVGLGNVDNTSDDTKNAATATLTNKTTTNLVLNGTATGTAIQDDDTFASASSSKLATSESIKAYIDNALAGATGVPVGASMLWSTDTLPSGWLWRNGAAVSRTTYADLFTAIGTTFGAGDGSTTFNVPDDRDRAIVGKGDMGGVTAAGLLTVPGSGIDSTTLGASGGSETHTLTLPQIPAHSHNISLASSSTNPGTAFVRTGDATGGGSTQTTVSQGGGGAHNNVQPTTITNTIIKY